MERVPDAVWLAVVCAGSFLLTWAWVYIWVFLPRRLGAADEPGPRDDPPRFLYLRRR
jgi:hypothetical protein